jgi:hypothetical protein
MSNPATTRMSSKGQVVIPEEIRGVTSLAEPAPRQGRPQLNGDVSR